MRAVHEAIYHDDAEELRRLVDGDPGLIEASFNGRSPLMYACEAGSEDMARVLVDRGADVNRKDEFGRPPLLMACELGRSELVQLLLDRGADPSVTDETGRTPLMGAMRRYDHSRSDFMAIIRLLLKNGRVPVNARDRFGHTALWEACFSADPERVRVLLVEGLADHTIAPYDGSTPITICRGWGYHGCTQLLQVCEGFNPH